MTIKAIELDHSHEPKSIKQAFEKGPIGHQRLVSDSAAALVDELKKRDPEPSERLKRDSKYSGNYRGFMPGALYGTYDSAIVKKKGAEILDTSSCKELLEECTEMIRLNYPDVKIKKGEIADNLEPAVYLSLRWNYHMYESYNSFDHATIFALPRNELVIVEGQEAELLEKEQWQNPHILRDAIMRAYANPRLNERVLPAFFP